ncbi:hypothetical protein HBB16_12980 [Pseudonocardia sp. MCCB 268]|nr:hypothetical protein [Pseudonocardia cytotoxica]
MIDVGCSTHDPVRAAHGEERPGPPGRAHRRVLAGVVSLDGDGSTTFIITVSALLPIYLRLGMSPVVLTVVATHNGALNIVPWAGRPSAPRPSSVSRRRSCSNPMIPAWCSAWSPCWCWPGSWAARSAGGSSRPAGRAVVAHEMDSGLRARPGWGRRGRRDRPAVVRHWKWRAAPVAPRTDRSATTPAWPGC